MSPAPDLSGYEDVFTRIRRFKALYPDGSLKAWRPPQLETVGDQTYLIYMAAAYRSPDDTHPGVGCAWEPVPGRTSYTRDSELQNAETSAWGRAIMAVLGPADGEHIASAQEVEGRKGRGMSTAALRSRVAELDEVRAQRLRAAAKAGNLASLRHPTISEAEASEWDRFITRAEELDDRGEPGP